MRGLRLWAELFRIQGAVIEDVRFDEDSEVLVVGVRPKVRSRSRCGICQRRCAGYDGGRGRRRWRDLNAGTVQVFVEAEAPRVLCREHGVVVAAVPWAGHGAGHTYAFDAQVAWLATRTAKATITALMQVGWRTVGQIVARVWAKESAGVDVLDGLARIGIDEISYKKGHRYLTIVVDHDSGSLVWAAVGRDSKTLRGFFDQLGAARCAQITHVSADGADYIDTVVRRYCRRAVRCADPFHVVKWAIDALDAVRAESWNDARRIARATEPARGPGRPRKGAAARPASQRAHALRGARYALWKNPENLTEHQHEKLAWIARTDPKLHRAYLLKEGLRTIFQMPIDQAREALENWLKWARRSRLAPFIKLARSITRHRQVILASIEHGLSNGLIESVNTKIRLLTRLAFGFKNPEALIALAMLSLGNHRVALPTRS